MFAIAVEVGEFDRNEVDDMYMYCGPYVSEFLKQLKTSLLIPFTWVLVRMFESNEKAISFSSSYSCKLYLNLLGLQRW